ncbi:mobilization protein [Flagellimonas olearia]|uniref:Mobilization protein n=1 Tax=Flagellimonas olearia TaxID=552546 RepID=A0A444VI29_9FLAO|nr:mobilization protein [Allomuricauda olearia]
MDTFLTDHWWVLYLLITLLIFGFQYFHRWAFWVLTVLFLGEGATLSAQLGWPQSAPLWLYAVLPAQFINAVMVLGLSLREDYDPIDHKYKVRLALRNGSLTLRNIRRGVSIIGSAGSGKTESVVYALLQHFHKHKFCGVIHDYKHFEITELAYPLFQDKDIPFHIVSFDTIHKRVNPIAPRYLPDEESVNEVSRVLLENLLEQRESIAHGSSKFFNDAVEGLLGGMIWMLRTHYPQYCTLPHLIAIYQYLNPWQLIHWLSGDLTVKAMADAFIAGKESERQTAGVLSTLANALKKISTRRIFMALSADEVDLDVNNPEHPSIVAIVNHPKYETAFSPIIATILHTITKQMSIRGRRHAFMLMEEAPTIRLLNMHRIPATLRSYDITTVYVMQDKAQNDMMYGEKASRTILSNLSYQFFGKVNDPSTALYYEQFFERIKRPFRSVTRKQDPFDPDTRVTKGEREVSKVRSDVFFRLRQGEFIAFSDGRDQRVRFPIPQWKRELPPPKYLGNSEKMAHNFQKIHAEAQALFKIAKD